MPGRRKAAILLVSLGTEAAAEVFRHLPEETIEQLTIEMARTRDVTPEDAEAVQREMIENAYARGYIAEGGIALRPRGARARRRRRSGPPRSCTGSAVVIEQTPFEFLRSTPPDQIARSCATSTRRRWRSCSPTCPRPTLAAKVMQLMPPEEQADVAIRIATMGKTSPDVDQGRSRR